MEIKRTTEILVETERRYVVHQPDNVEQVFCPGCNELMITAEQAAVIFELSHRTVYQLVENGTAHFTETETGVLFVCPNSLVCREATTGERGPCKSQLSGDVSTDTR
jgi:hypothetical protein